MLVAVHPTDREQTMTTVDTTVTLPRPRRSPEGSTTRKPRPSSEYWDVTEARWVSCAARAGG
jgi:hypothetical protein